MRLVLLLGYKPQLYMMLKMKVVERAQLSSFRVSVESKILAVFVAGYNGSTTCLDSRESCEGEARDVHEGQFCVSILSNNFLNIVGLSL